MNYHARHLESTKNSVLLKIVPVTLEGPNGTIERCALCDEASTITIIEEEIANVLGCVGEKEPLTMKWTDDTIKKENGSRKLLTGQGYFMSYFHKSRIRDTLVCDSAEDNAKHTVSTDGTKHGKKTEDDVGEQIQPDNIVEITINME
ncbi:hypothetical protein JTB14_010745 [Gonioctena quinquepunctata]|nr:hypothetical protein JTB14_010745 [Gonioctena quinquepunctata]